MVRPHRRIDALRGCAAIERGPLVYCFEQIDQDTELDDLALAPGAALRTVERDLPGIGRTVLVEAGALRLPPAPPRGLPYTTGADAAPAARATATAVPYYQWDNRDGGVMRVWMPLA
ncbi:hypothetical protein [Nonomuraea rubra]|uniref:hypothetical protein n=1 Tax=Nonomuraea rubra TaxID=46180 RepID=UPI0031E6AB97